MALYCLTEMGALRVITSLWSLDCVKWTLLSWVLQSLFKVLTGNRLPWVIEEKPLTLNYWYFLPFRTSILSAASLSTHFSPTEVKWLLCYSKSGTDDQLLYSVKPPACRDWSSDLLPAKRGLEVKALSNWEVPGGSQHDHVWADYLSNSTVHG